MTSSLASRVDTRTRRLPDSFAVGVIGGAHVLLCLVLARMLNVWLDEAFSLETTSAGLAIAFRRAIDFEMQPPLYFALLAAWRMISNGYVFARMLSVFCTAALLVAMARLWRRLVPDVHPGWLVAVLAFHPFTVYAAVEIRLYAMAMLLSALLLALFFEEFVGNGGSRHRKMFFAATSIAALWTQFYLGFLLAVQGGVLVLLRRWRAVGSYLAAMAIAAIALAPLVPGVTGELEGHTQGVRERFGVVDQARFVYSRLAYYVLPRETQSPELVKIARDVVMLGATLAVGARLLRRPRPALSRAAFVLATIVAGLMATFVVAILYIGTQELVLVRHTVAVFVPVILLTLVVMAEVGGRRAVIATALVMLTFEVADLAAVYLPRPAKRGDWLAVARYIEANEAPGQPILTFRAPSQLPLAIHYHGPNPIVPVPRPNNRDHWVLEDTQLRSPDDVMRVLNALPGQPRTIWLVTDTIWSTMGISFHHEILEDVVARDFAVKLDRSFFASRARLLERR